MKYYVSAIDGNRSWLLAGPYKSHNRAISMVRTVRAKAIEQDPFNCFKSFGTCGSPAKHDTPLGAL